jgi:UDP-N-acetylglucosamine transferase subunit ALG13
MIFVTVGTDLPFDRLVLAVDTWAGERGRSDVFAQVGRSRCQPRHLRSQPFLEPEEYRDCFNQASVIVAHAGMGTILSALQWGKPLLVMPRRASLGEHRNEHQLATARHLASLDKINVSFDEASLREELDRLATLTPRARIGPHAGEALVGALRDFISSP